MSNGSFRALTFALALTPALGLSAAGAVTAHAAAPATAATCRQVRTQNPLAQDGNYTLYNNGYVFRVYCYDMARNPREYISLAVTGTGVNFSQYTAGGASPGTNVRTTFTKLRINPATLTVDIGDLTFATSTGSLRQVGTTPVTSMPYGVASSCVNPMVGSGLANINLLGTAFKVDNPFILSGWRVAGSETVLSDYQVVNLTGGGYCGTMTPYPAVYNPVNPDPGEYFLKLSCADETVTRDQFCRRA